MNKSDYKKELAKYRGPISLEQFCKIARISKRKGKWLLDNGLIPCADSGKKTRRYLIAKKDVAAFLKARDTGNIQSRIPQGIFASKHPRKYPPLPAIDPNAFAAFLETEWAEYPDMLTAKEAMKASGFAHGTIFEKIKNKSLVSVLYRGTHLITKTSLAVHLTDVVCRTRPWMPFKVRELAGRFLCSLDESPKYQQQI